MSELRSSAIRRASSMTGTPAQQAPVEPLLDVDRQIPRSEVADFVRLVQAGFKQPRKTLANSLAEGLGCPRQVATDLLVRTGIDASQRPQALSVADWVRLYRNV